MLDRESFLFVYPNQCALCSLIYPLSSVLQKTHFQSTKLGNILFLKSQSVVLFSQNKYKWLLNSRSVFPIKQILNSTKENYRIFSLCFFAYPGTLRSSWSSHMSLNNTCERSLDVAQLASLLWFDRNKISERASQAAVYMLHSPHSYLEAFLERS